MHSNRDLETTTPVTPSDRRHAPLDDGGPVQGGAGDRAIDPPPAGLSQNRPEAAVPGASMPGGDETDEPEEMTPGPSDVNGG